MGSSQTAGEVRMNDSEGVSEAVREVDYKGAIEFTI